MFTVRLQILPNFIDFFKSESCFSSDPPPTKSGPPPISVNFVCNFAHIYNSFLNMYMHTYTQMIIQTRNGTLLLLNGGMTPLTGPSIHLCVWCVFQDIEIELILVTVLEYSASESILTHLIADR